MVAGICSDTLGELTAPPGPLVSRHGAAEKGKERKEKEEGKNIGSEGRKEEGRDEEEKEGERMDKLVLITNRKS